MPIGRESWIGHDAAHVTGVGIGEDVVISKDVIP